MTTRPKQIVITGAAGTVAQAVIEALAPSCDLTLIDQVAHPSHPTQVLDMADFDALVQAIPTDATVIHLGAIPEEADPKLIIHNNIQATFNVFEAARTRGADRVIFASTTMIYWGYQVTQKKPAKPLSPLRHCRPTTHYAVSKLYAEHLGYLYATEHDLSVIGIRLGWYPRKAELQGMATAVEVLEQASHILIGHEDCKQLFCRCVEAADVTSIVVNGFSLAGTDYFDLEPGRSVIGYHPQEDAQAVIRTHMKRLANISRL